MLNCPNFIIKNDFVTNAYNSFPALSADSLTLNQQMPIKSDEQVVLDLNLGSSFATKLGLSDLDEWDATTATTVSESSVDETVDVVLEGGDNSGGGKKKKKNKKKNKK